MAMKFSEAIRRRMGWCPNAAMVGTGRRRYAAPGDEIGIGTAVAEGEREATAGAFVDYVGPRFLPLLLLAIAGFFVFFVVCLLIPSLRPGFYTLLALSQMTYATVHLYLDRKRAVIESSGNSVIVCRPRSRPLVFGKDTVRSVEVKKTYLPIPRWAFAMLMLLMIAVMFFTLLGRELMGYLGGQAVYPDFAFQVLLAVGFAMFMLELLYRSLVSLQYPSHLRVRLESGGFLHIYSGDPDRLAALLGAPRWRSVPFEDNNPMYIVTILDELPYQRRSHEHPPSAGAVMNDR